MYLLRVTETDVALGFAQRYRKQNGDWGRMQALYPYSIERLHSIGAADREVIAMVEHALPEVDYVARGQMEIYQAETALSAEQLALIRRMPAVPAALKEDLTVHLNHAMSDAMDSDEAPADIELLSEATPIMRLVGVPAAGSGLLPALQLRVR